MSYIGLSVTSCVIDMHQQYGNQLVLITFLLTVFNQLTNVKCKVVILWTDFFVGFVS